MMEGLEMTEPFIISFTLQLLNLIGGPLLEAEINVACSVQSAQNLLMCMVRFPLLSVEFRATFLGKNQMISFVWAIFCVH